MCGILAAINFGENNDKSVNNDIINMFQDQRGRGTEGFGIVMIQRNGDYRIKRATNEIKSLIDLYMEEAPMIIMHHRQPTSSDNLINQTHPIVVDNKLLKHKYLVIHNGVISNDDEILKEHEALGFVYTTKHDDLGISKFNDSESLAIEVARYIEKQTKEIGTLGSAAFIAIQIVKETNKVDKIYYGRNKSNPLKLGATRGKIRLSSIGQGEEVKEELLYNFNLGDFKIHKEELAFATWHSKHPTNYSNPHWRNDDDWEDYDPKTDTFQDKGGFKKDLEPRNLPTIIDGKTTVEEDDNEPDIETADDCEMAIEKETEDLTEAVGIIMEQFVEDIKDERQVFVAEPKEYLAMILSEMYKTRKRVEDITREKLMLQVEELKELDKDLPPLNNVAQE